MSKPEIVLIRHGETEWSRDHRHTGRTDVPLTDNGRRQAAALRQRLEQWTFKWVLVSPLRRAVETSELAGLGDRAELRPELMEFDYGEAEGLTTAQMRERIPNWAMWTHGSPGGESPADVASRIEPLLAKLRETEGDVAIVAHGHVLRVLAASWIDMPPEGGSRLALGTGTLSVLSWERETEVIQRWNA